jgi:flagellin-like protein
MKFEKQTADSGVSPVVGVILMVAITVILSAIIATFVLDLGGTVSQNPAAGVTFDTTATDDTSTADTAEGAMTVQVISMENADSLALQTTNADNGGESAISAGSLGGVGSTADVTNLEDGDTVTVTATLDGKTSVIQTYTHNA